MDNTTISGSEATPTGWCDSRDPQHDGRYDHPRQPNCRNFISDSEHTARLIAEARDRDGKVTARYPSGAATPAAAYIDEYRPY